MGLFIITGLWALIAIGLIAYGPNRTFKFVGGALVLPLIALLLYRSAWVINEGQTGATRFLGSVSDQVYPGGRGIVFVNPWADRYTTDSRARLAQFRGESALSMTLGRGGVFTMEAGVPYTFNGAYAGRMLAQTSFTIDDAATNAIRAGFRDVAQRYATYDEFSRRRQNADEYADAGTLEEEIRRLAQGHLDEFFFRSVGMQRIGEAPVISVGAVQIRKVTPSATVQAAANEYEAELTALRTAEAQRQRAVIEAQRVEAIIPALRGIAEVIPQGQTAEGFASAVNAAAQLRLTEAQAKAFAATADALADPDRGVSPTIIVGGGGLTPTLPVR